MYPKNYVLSHYIVRVYRDFSNQLDQMFTSSRDHYSESQTSFSKTGLPIIHRKYYQLILINFRKYLAIGNVLVFVYEIYKEDSKF